MSRRAKIALVSLTALNVVAFAINISWPTRAAVGGMSYDDLMRDPDFTRGQVCRPGMQGQVDIAKLICN